MYFIALTVSPVNIMCLINKQTNKNSDTFLTGMHLAVITGDRFFADFSHLKQAY